MCVCALDRVCLYLNAECMNKASERYPIDLSTMWKEGLRERLLILTALATVENQKNPLLSAHLRLPTNLNYSLFSHLAISLPGGFSEHMQESGSKYIHNWAEG